MELNKYKVVFIGDTGVGKTSIIKKKQNRTFTLSAEPTVGVGTTSIIVDFEDNKVDLSVCDTAGQEKYSNVVKVFFRNTIVAVTVASCTDHESIKNIKKWIEALKENTEDPAVVVVVNKIDMVSAVTDSLDKIKEDLSVEYENIFFTSAKTGEGIEDVFCKVAQLALESKNKNAVINYHEPVPLKSKDKPKGCCK